MSHQCVKGEHKMCPDSIHDNFLCNCYCHIGIGEVKAGLQPKYREILREPYRKPLVRIQVLLPRRELYEQLNELFYTVYQCEERARKLPLTWGC